MATAFSKDFVPSSDAEFFQWAQQLVSTVAKDPAAYGIAADELTDVQGKETTFDTSYVGMIEQRDAAKAATSQKNEARKTFEESIRVLAKQIQSNPNVDVQQKLAAGLPAHDNKPTPRTIPTNSPDVLINANRLRHEFRFSDPDFPSRGSRPSGVISIEISAFIGEEAPTDVEQFHSLGVSTRMKHSIDFPVSDGGKGIWYRFRWIGTRGELGTWSALHEAKIWS